MRALDVNDKLLFLEAGLNEMKLDAQIKLTAKLERNLAKCVHPHLYMSCGEGLGAHRPVRNILTLFDFGASGSTGTPRMRMRRRSGA